jgi:hypothetical protein
MRTPDAVRQQQWRDRQVKPTRSARPDHHGRIEPDPYFAMAVEVSGYKGSRCAQIRPALERLEASGPVLTLVHDGKPVFGTERPLIHGIEGVRLQFLIEPDRDYECTRCHGHFVTKSRTRKHCPDCKAIIQREHDRAGKLRRRRMA